MLTLSQCEPRVATWAPAWQAPALLCCVQLPAGSCKKTHAVMAYRQLELDFPSVCHMTIPARGLCLRHVSL